MEQVERLLSPSRTWQKHAVSMVMVVCAQETPGKQGQGHTRLRLEVQLRTACAWEQTTHTALT